MPYHIRSLDTTTDLSRVVELVNTVNPEQVSEKAFGRGRSGKYQDE